MWNNKKFTLKYIVISIGVCCMGGGGGSVINYIFGNGKLMMWNSGVGMALSTSWCILFIGIALYILGRHKIHE